MQSQQRKFNRINSGLQNPSPSSTKISRRTKGESLGYAGYRKNRFARAVFTIPLMGIKNYSLKGWIEKLINSGRLKLAWS